MTGFLSDPDVERRCEHVIQGEPPVHLEIEYRIDGEWVASHGSPRDVCRPCMDAFQKPSSVRSPRCTGWRWTVTV